MVIFAKRLLCVYELGIEWLSFEYFSKHVKQGAAHILGTNGAIGDDAGGGRSSSGELERVETGANVVLAFHTQPQQRVLIHLQLLTTTHLNVRVNARRLNTN